MARKLFQYLRWILRSFSSFKPSIVACSAVFFKLITFIAPDSLPSWPWVNLEGYHFWKWKIKKIGALVVVGVFSFESFECSKTIIQLNSLNLVLAGMEAPCSLSSVKNCITQMAVLVDATHCYQIPPSVSMPFGDFCQILPLSPLRIRF